MDEMQRNRQQAMHIAQALFASLLGEAQKSSDPGKNGVGAMNVAEQNEIAIELIKSSIVAFVVMNKVDGRNEQQVEVNLVSFCGFMQGLADEMKDVVNNPHFDGVFDTARKIGRDMVLQMGLPL